MSEEAGMTMEEAEEAEEGENHTEERNVTHNNIEETPEDLMTDMKLEDEIDELRMTDPDFQWLYHIEIYPWNADDMTENFVRLMKLADFTQIFMRKKGASKETRKQESMDDKLHDRQRKGSVHLYTDSYQNAKLIIRSSTWKAMTSKQLTFEITRRDPGSHGLESAFLEVDTYTACKCRYRDRPKGEFKDRTAKVSSIPGEISREFLDVVLCRAIPVLGGSSVKEYYQERDGKLHQKLCQIKDFKGSLDFDCLTKASCRAFVTAHKNVYIEGQRISIDANSKGTMTAPPPAPNVVPSAMNYTAIVANKRLPTPNASEPSWLQNSEMDTKSQHEANRGTLTQQAMFRTNTASHVSQVGRGGLMREPSGFSVSARGRGIGRSTLLPQRPANNTISRSGPGMPVPMTGRQKMNEKMRRSNQGLAPGPSVTNNMSSSQGGLMVPRSAISASLGESFKQEIALLQKQLQQNTAELEAKIALLRESTNSAALYDEWEENWDETAFGGEEDYSPDNFVSEDDSGYSNLPLSGNYQLYFDDIANQHSIASSEDQVAHNVVNVQNKATAARAELQLGSMIASHEMVARPMQAPCGDFGQPPVSHMAIMSVPQSQTRLGQSFQHATGHLPPNMLGNISRHKQSQIPQIVVDPQTMQRQMPKIMPGQTPQTMAGQMPQTMPGQMPQTMVGQMPQTMTGQMPQPAPVQLAQALLDQISQVLPGQLRPANHGHGAPPGQFCAQRGRGRGGGGYYQKMGGRGKSMPGSGPWG